MNNTQAQIRNLPFLLVNKAYEINNSVADGFLVRAQHEYQIAIPYQGPDYFDEFVGISISTNEFDYEGKTFPVLYLHAKDDISMDQLAPIAEEFLLKKNRAFLTANPEEWFDGWRKIFGDAMRKYSPYDVLGEMIALREVYKKDKTAKWMGPKSGSQDIVCEKQVIEVKTTTRKKESEIHVNSAVQLAADKPEFLMFVRLEYTSQGLTIDDLKDELVKVGYSETKIEDNLVQKGMLKGSKSRRIPYDVLEVSLYPVNKNTFPIISLEKINELAPTKNIMDYQLLLDLNTIPHKVLYEKGK